MGGYFATDRDKVESIGSRMAVNLANWLEKFINDMAEGATRAREWIKRFENFILMTVEFIKKKAVNWCETVFGGENFFTVVARLTCISLVHGLEDIVVGAMDFVFDIADCALQKVETLPDLLSQ